MSEQKRLFLIDGSALAYRSYYAFVRSPLINSKGLNTSAIYGFAAAVLRLMEQETPDRLAVVFDSSEPTFRHEQFPDYKATREKMPDEMSEQLPLIDEVVEALGIPILREDGYEADDVIGTLARRAEDEGWEVFIVTGDKDFMQVVSDRVKLYDAMKQDRDVEIVGPQEVEEKFGVAPEKVTDVLGLMGDSSDNIPGVRGVGEKTAAKLVQQFGSLEAALDHADEVKGKRAREGLQQDSENALLSKRLVTLDTNAPVKFDPEAFGVHEPDAERIIQLFQELEFPSLLDKLDLGHETQGTRYQTVSDPEAFAALVQRLRRADEVCVDTETTSTSPMAAELVGLSFAVAEQEAFYVPVRAKAPVVSGGGGLFGEAESHLDAILDGLRPVLEDPDLPKGGQNIKYDMVVLANHGVDLQGVAFDTMVESYLLDPSARQHKLDVLAMKHLSLKMTPITELIGKGKAQISMAEVPVEQASAYACEDADVTLRLHHLFLPQLDEHGLADLYAQVEVPLIPVLARMERRGVRVDLELLAELSARFAEQIAELERAIWELAGEQFNINSTQQLGAILFETLEIHKARGQRLRRTKTGYATSVAALEPYADVPIVQKVLEYRSLTKLKSTYIDAFPALVHPETGKIHTSFNQTVTATGRLSSSEPNLQNIPIRTELGRGVRKAFIPSTPQRRLLSADYSQIELRVLAHLSGDPTLAGAFRRGEDIHRRTASEIFDVPMDDVSPELRSRAKAINFGIVYGMGPQRLARDTGISLEEARGFIDRYFERYPKIKEFIDTTIADAERDGYVSTLLGRRRAMPELFSENAGQRAAGERIAVNTPIQGTAADLIKVAMVRLDARLRERYPEAWMILQVHDELVFDVPEAQVEEVGALVREEMEGAIELDVPLKVDIAVAQNWAKA
ncbi:MAG: DNA polymerase I [Planctomycetota bacterium]